MAISGCVLPMTRLGYWSILLVDRQVCRDHGRRTIQVGIFKTRNNNKYIYRSADYEFANKKRGRSQDRHRIECIRRLSMSGLILTWARDPLIK
jgi:hypothetical protein